MCDDANGSAAASAAEVDPLRQERQGAPLFQAAAVAMAGSTPEPEEPLLEPRLAPELLQRLLQCLLDNWEVIAARAPPNKSDIKEKYYS